jgi:prepilin-type N-terminal cleavage/methylation domain-containing protein
LRTSPISVASLFPIGFSVQRHVPHEKVLTRRRGFTLIELLVVIAIIAAVV